MSLTSVLHIPVKGPENSNKIADMNTVGHCIVLVASLLQDCNICAFRGQLSCGSQASHASSNDYSVIDDVRSGLCRVLSLTGTCWSCKRLCPTRRTLAASSANLAHRAISYVVRCLPPRETRVIQQSNIFEFRYSTAKTTRAHFAIRRYFHRVWPSIAPQHLSA